MRTLRILEDELRGKYLTENSLGDILEVLFPEQVWGHDKKFKCNDELYNIRPDYCCHNLKMIVEFDGPDHYTKANVIQADLRKDMLVKSLGYQVIRVPYFIQLKTDAIKYLFDIDVDFNYGFKHGFISKGVPLPASFCQQGVWKFKDLLSDLGHESSIFKEIKESLISKIENSKLIHEAATLTVIPTELFLTFNIIKRDYSSSRNQRLIRSNLKSNWNGVMLESSLVMSDQDGFYDLEYTYSPEGDISGYSFKLFYKNIFSIKYTLLAEKTGEDMVLITTYRDDVLKFKGLLSVEEVNIFNIPDFLTFEVLGDISKK